MTLYNNCRPVARVGLRGAARHRAAGGAGGADNLRDPAQNKYITQQRQLTRQFNITNKTANNLRSPAAHAG